ncbi:MAG: hypothetical protein H0X51_02450 [Parachlamydiaceae bacterium]|nr:hypothetical protein [Parachlamydiaceae bacterium]
MKYIILFIALMSHTSTFALENLTGQGTRLVRAYTNQMEKLLGVKCVKFDGNYAGEIRMMGMCYRLQRHVNLEQARALYAYMTQEFLDLANNDKKARIALHNYPATINNLNLRITFCDAKDMPLHSPCIAAISVENEITKYYVVEKDLDFTLYFQEPYSETVSLAKSKSREN